MYVMLVFYTTHSLLYIGNVIYGHLRRFFVYFILTAYLATQGPYKKRK